MAMSHGHSPESLLSRLAALEVKSFEPVARIRLAGFDPEALDSKTSALVRIGALLAAGARAPTYGWAVALAFSAGATDEEIIGVLIAVASTIGIARVVPAAPALGLAMGYDIEAALEGRED